MAESVDEFFDDEDFTGMQLAGAARVIHCFLSDDSILPEKASQDILSLYNAPESFQLQSVIANIVLPLAEQLPVTHDRLLKLLAELQGLTCSSTNIPSATLLKPNDKLSLDYELWERGLRYGDPDPNHNLRDLLRAEWTAVNGFAALVYAAGMEDILSAFGEHTLELALRRGQWRVCWDGLWGADASVDKIDAFHGHIGAAAQWILVCGRRLFNECQSVREQWVRWQQDLAWLIEQDGLKDEAKTLCEKVLTEMNRVMSP